MMGGRNFARGIFGDDTFLSPPLELQIGLGGFGQNDVTLHPILYCIARVDCKYTIYILDDFRQNDVTLIEELRSLVH